MEKTIRFIKGDTTTLTWEFTNSLTNLPVDMSSKVFTFTVKKRFRYADSLASIQKTGNSFSITLGTVTLALSSSDTKINSGVYVADLQWNDTGKIVTVGVYNLEVLEEVSINE